MRATWFAHDVPGGQHLRPGFLMDFTLYTQDKYFTLPCRSINVSFPARPPDDPGETWVRFDGDFGILFSDRRYLWKAMLQRQRQLTPSPATVIANAASEDIPPGSFVNMAPNEAADGFRTTFSFSITLYSGEFALYVNGLLQREGLDYTYNASSGQVTFVVAPGEGDQLWAVGYGSN
jgi:hypothetical protein